MLAKLNLLILSNIQISLICFIFFSVTTAQVPATIPSPKQKQETLESSKKPKRSSQHMAEVVQAAVAASKIQERKYSIASIMLNLIFIVSTY